MAHRYGKRERMRKVTVLGLLLLALLVAGTIFLVVEFLAAPEGYEDENGFSLGRKAGK